MSGAGAGRVGVATRRFARVYRVPVTPSRVWEHLTDPAAVGAVSHHRVRVVDRTPGFEVGTRWVEVHDDDCGSAPVPWVVLACAPPSATAGAPVTGSFTTEGLQSGARQRATTELRAVDGGTEVTAAIELRPSLRARGSVFERLVLTVICVTGLGTSIVAEEFDRAVADDAAHLGATGA